MTKHLQMTDEILHERRNQDPISGRRFVVFHGWSYISVHFHFHVCIGILLRQTRGYGARRESALSPEPGLQKAIQAADQRMPPGQSYNLYAEFFLSIRQIGAGFRKGLDDSLLQCKENFQVTVGRRPLVHGHEVYRHFLVLRLCRVEQQKINWKKTYNINKK